MAGGALYVCSTRILLLLHAQAQAQLSELEHCQCTRCYSTSVVLHGPESFSVSITPSHILLNRFLICQIQDVKAQAVQMSNAYCKVHCFRP